MKVETFECAETAAEPIEACEEAVSIIEELELAGQKKLVHKKEDGRDERNPYREIRADERFVYQTLCPQSEMLNRYEAGPVPLRVLQIAAHASKIFPKLRVWYQADSAEKDPVLVGCDGQYDWTDDKTYILARWGEELETFSVLLSRAVEKARHALTQQAQSVLSKVAAATDAELIERGPNRDITW